MIAIYAFTSFLRLSSRAFYLLNEHLVAPKSSTIPSRQHFVSVLSWVVSQLNCCSAFGIHANHGSGLAGYLWSLHILPCSLLHQFWEQNCKTSQENGIPWQQGVINAHFGHASGVPLLDWNCTMMISIQQVSRTRIWHATLWGKICKWTACYGTRSIQHIFHSLSICRVRISDAKEHATIAENAP